MNLIPSRLAVATALSFAVMAAPAWASEVSDTEDSTADDQQTDRSESQSGERAEDPHSRGDILVSADSLKELDFIAGQNVIELDEIQQNLSGQLGELLTKVPGVSASSFSPGASRPILRGLDGERVRILIDGLGTADVGNTSADHATTIDPLTVERIEVLRGPAALLFGSQAIGGVVNVIDRRIPIAVPENGIHVDGLSAFDTASNLRSGGASIDAALNDIFVLHLDGSYRETDDLEIPGFQLAPGFRSEVLALADEEEAEGEFEEAEEFREAANQSGTLPNSATETWTINGGLGVILGDSSFGASVGYYETDYGLVGRPGAEHAEGEGEEAGEEESEEEEEIVTIGLEQLRVDFRGDIGLGDGFFSRLKLRAGYSDYTHTEFEGAEVGTVFDTETFEARAELVRNGGGVIGAQFTSRDFAAVGEEAFVAPNDTTQLAIFTAQEFEFGGVEIEPAGRYEYVDVESEPLGLDRNFNLFSGALSAILVSEGGSRFGATVSRSERAPAGEELFANGPHIATQTFEIGDPNLDTESAWGLETFLRVNSGDLAFNVSVYYQSFDDFIFLSPTGGEQDDLPVFEFLQDDAQFFGFEAGLELPLIENDKFTLGADLRASYVDAEGGGDTDLPRIPPLSLLAALDAGYDAFELRGEIQWFDQQNEVAEFETPTEDFAFVNVFLSWRPLENNQNVVLQLAGENLFDTTGRRHTSFTKDFVPLSGRNIRASARFSF